MQNRYLKFSLKLIVLLLGLITIFYFLKGHFVLAGVFFIILSGLNIIQYRSPYLILLILIGLLLILVGLGKTYLMIIVAILISVIAFFDVVCLIKLIKNKKYNTTEELFKLMKKEELLYKIWKKFV